MCASAADWGPLCWEPTDGVENSTPTAVLGFQKVRTGASVVCAADDGDYACWDGQGLLEAFPTPSSLRLLVAVPVNGGLGCGLTLDDEVFCWTTQGVHQPLVDWSPLGAFTELVINYDHGCAVSQDDGHIECWGKGQGGLGQELGPPGDGYHCLVGHELSNCALDSSDHVYCWGGQEQLGQVPTQTFVEIDGSNGCYCGITTDDDVLCWGVVDGEQCPQPPSEMPALVPPRVEWSF